MSLKSDLIFVGDNGKIHLVVLALIFFTKPNDFGDLEESLKRLFALIKPHFVLGDKINKKLFTEVLDIYLFTVHNGVFF